VTIDREKVLQAAQGFIQKKRYDRAVAEYQKLIQQDPDDVRILLKIGDLQSKMEAHADAIATYERVGKHYAAQGFALKAIAVYKQIREIIRKHVPNLAERYDHITPQLADLYAQLGLITDALAAYDEVATQLQRSGQDRRAIEVFQKIVALDDTNPLPHLRLAEAHSRIKNVDAAIAHFSTAADILIKLKRHDDALKVLERLLHHRSDPAFAQQAAEIYLERARPNDGMMALAKLQICFQADPKNLGTLALLARAFVSIGQPAKSLEVQKELARLAKEQGKLDVYRETVDRLTRAAPNDEAVQRLAASMSDAAPPRVSAQPVSDAAIALSDGEIEELSEDDLGDAEIIPSEAPTAQAQIIAAHPYASTRAPNVSAPELEVVDEPGVPGAADEEDPEIALQAQRAMADAESFYRLGLFSKAIQRLEGATQLQPQSVVVRRKLRDILYEQEQYERTAEEMVAIGSVFIEVGDLEHAAEELLAIFTFMPDHPVARQMLLDLGYEPPQNGEAVPPTEGVVPDAYHPAHDTEADIPPAAMRSDSMPLPSYDLEEIGPAEAMSSPGYDVRAETYEQKREALGSTPLPSFPMEDEPSEVPEAAAPRARHAAMPGPLGAGGGDSIEDVLEEAEFFITRGLLDDARNILEEQLRRNPNHPLLNERMRELALAANDVKSSSGTRERPQHELDAPADPRTISDRAFDIAASLDALDALDASPQPGMMNDVQQVDVEEVFAKFKAGVREQISEGDSATHYDLGLAYHGMGLVADAIDEFTVAGADPKRECVCHSMIGMIHRAQGNVNAAIDAFMKGLHAEQKTPEQELKLYYELGDAYDSKGNSSEALYYFRRVAHRDASFNDPRGAVAARIRAVQAGEKRSPRAQAVNASNEFEDAFDAALTGGKRS
jgi:tetratricopeptide (TPR) repeat protein